MSILKKAALSASVVLAMGLAVNPAQASYVEAVSEMAVSNLQFSSSDILAQLVWTDVWYGTVTAHGQDTDSGSADEFNDLLGNNGPVEANANTGSAQSKATYEVVNGDQIATNPIGQIGATSHSELQLTNANKQGDGFAIADFDNFFFVTGGTPGDAVEVTFTLDYEGKPDATTDWESYFRVELAALLEVWETDFFGTPLNLLAYDIVADSKEGSGTSVAQTYMGTLTATTTLLYDQEYWLIGGADSEVYGVTPAPGTLALLLLGTAFVVRRRGKPAQI
jgi:hypothetical protein